MNTTPQTVRPETTTRGWNFFAGLVHRLSPLRGGLMLFVGLPTVLTVLYYGLLASDIYVSESAFSVRLEQGQNLGAEMGMILPGLLGSSGQQDQLTVNAFIQSRAMVDALSKTVDLKAMYRSPKADWLARLPEPVTQEDLVQYYQKRILVLYDERAMISNLKIQAFTAEESQVLNEAILDAAEAFVNSLSHKMRQDSIAFAEAQVLAAEKDLTEANRMMTEFRETHGNFDPPSASTGAVGLMQGIEAKLAEKRAELDTARGIMTPQNPRIQNLTREVAALERQVERQRTGLTGGKPETLSRQLEAYAEVALRQEFATKRYALAMAGLEGARAEAGRKSIYLTRVVEPSLPDIAAEPRRLHRILSVFFLSLAGYGMLLLIAASIGDHIRR